MLVILVRLISTSCCNNSKTSDLIQWNVFLLYSKSLAKTPLTNFWLSERCPCYPLSLWSLNIHVLPYSHTQHTFNSFPVRADLKSHPVTISSSQPIISEWCVVSPPCSHVVKTSWLSSLWTKKTSSPFCSHLHIQYTVVEQGQGNLRTGSLLGKEVYKV